MPYVAPEGTELVEALGAGSVFDVALVRERGHAAVLVCKRLSSRARHEPAARAAMVREARLLALATGPALPAVVRVGADAHGPFVLETRVEGRTLRWVADAWRSAGATVPPRLVSHVAALAADAIAELHGLVHDGLPLAAVHGDLTPDHFVLGPRGEIGVVDFGAARFRGMDPTLETADRGTLPYAAPEVARGDAAPSQAADVYALAATILAFGAEVPLTEARDEAAMLLEIGERGLRARHDVLASSFSDAAGREALARALDPDPAARPSARSLRDALA
jgi:eukaryotic-like serine/threonine-protein kinase